MICDSNNHIYIYVSKNYIYHVSYVYIKQYTLIINCKQLSYISMIWILTSTPNTLVIQNLPEKSKQVVVEGTVCSVRLSKPPNKPTDRAQRLKNLQLVVEPTSVETYAARQIETSTYQQYKCWIVSETSFPSVHPISSLALGPQNLTSMMPVFKFKPTRTWYESWGLQWATSL